MIIPAKGSSTIILLMSLVISSTALCGEDQAQSSLALLFQSLLHPKLDEHHAWEMNGNFIIRGGQGIYLTEGILRAAQPVHDHTFLSVFTGKGTLMLAFPTKLECSEFEHQTSSVTHQQKYPYSFSQAVFWFQDSILTDVGATDSSSLHDLDSREENAVERSIKFVNGPSMDVLHRLMREMLEPEPRQYMLAHFFLTNGGEVFLLYDVRRFEEVALLKPIPSIPETRTIPEYALNLINSFHLPEEYLLKSEYDLSSEDKHELRFLKNTIDLKIDEDGMTYGKAKVDYQPRISGISTLSFQLDPSLTVDSIKSGSGKPVEFHRSESRWEGFILLPIWDTSQAWMTFYYHGEFFKSTYGRTFVIWANAGDTKEPASSTGWYPQQQFLEHTLFDVTYHVPKEMELVAAGRKQSEDAIRDTKSVRYITSEPDLICSFSLGSYKKLTYQLDQTEPPITLYDAGTGEREKAIRNLAMSMKLYTSLFGNCGYSELNAVNVPSDHGQAFQDYIKMPWFEEMVGHSGPAVAIGQAHEVAHAWWGHGVGWKSYHDVWLCEGFAQYSALLYAAFVLQDDPKLFEKLKEWKLEISGDRGYLRRPGHPSGAIWLGYRVSTLQAPFDYSLSVYEKGAWVLHMLRMMMLDLTTLKEDAFKSMMSEFFLSFRGKDASTADFIAIVNKYFHTDMHWFFDQWICGTEIPTLKCSKSVTKTPAGKYALTISIEQKDVSSPFTFFLPIEVKYQNGSLGRTRLLVDQKQKDFTFEVDQEPADVKYNIMESLLCKIED